MSTIVITAGDTPPAQPFGAVVDGVAQSMSTGWVGTQQILDERRDAITDPVFVTELATRGGRSDFVARMPKALAALMTGRAIVPARYVWLLTAENGSAKRTTEVELHVLRRDAADAVDGPGPSEPVGPGAGSAATQQNAADIARLFADAPIRWRPGYGGTRTWALDESGAPVAYHATPGSTETARGNTAPGTDGSVWTPTPNTSAGDPVAAYNTAKSA